MSDEAPAIGIDLGTTNSCAAVLKDDKIVLIHGEDGRYITASFVFFDKFGSRTVGNMAKDISYRNIENGIFGVKRFIGRTYQEFKNEKCTSIFPYTVENYNKMPSIVVKCKQKTMNFFPEEISAMVLSKLKEQAELILGKKVTKAVITVPAHFNGTQRQATIDAGKIAGLKVLRIINEPTAAILAFEINNKFKGRSCNVLVYDFGGGTFDVSIANICDAEITIKASNGDAYLGGDDLDNNLTEYFIQHFYKEHKINLTKVPLALERLRQQAEKTKIMLSHVGEHAVSLDLINNDLDFECRVSRFTFEKINMNLFNKTLQCIEKTLNEANMKKEDIDEILLVGGSTRIPYVTDLVKNYFKKEPNASIHPDEAVAIGAARQAAISNSGLHICEALTSVKLFDVCSLSLGIRITGDLMSVIIPRNSTLPVSQTERYQTVVDNQTEIKIDIYEGERPLIADNKHLATFYLKDIKKAPKGQTKHAVTFSIDENGILKATSKEVGVQNSSNIEVNIHSNNLSEKEIKIMLANAEKFKEDDMKKKEIAIARNILEDKHYKLKNLSNKTTEPIVKTRMLKTYDEITNWLNSSKNQSIVEINRKIDEIEKCLNFRKSELDIEEIWQ